MAANSLLSGAARLIIATSVWVAAVCSASAGSTWDDLKPVLYGDRTISSGDGIISFHAPFRAEDDRRVPVSAEAKFADGRSIKAVSFIIDENPMPVAATFNFPADHSKIGLGVDLRLNGPSQVRAIVEASDGQLYMVDQLIKTSGLGACAAPPVTDPKQVASTIGQMALNDVTPLAGHARTTILNRRAQLEIRHPQNTGMQMDQITLLFIPARYVTDVSVNLGDEHLFDMTGGFALAENPRIEFDFRINGAPEFAVRVKDSDKAMFEHSFPLAAGG